MIGFDCFTSDESKIVVDRSKKSAANSLYKAAYAIAQTAKGEIVQSPDPSRPGQPPHTRRGQLKRAIFYAVDKPNLNAVIGPRESVLGPSGDPHEHGGGFRGQVFDERPFMGPALDSNQGKTVGLFADTL